ncbi:MAG: hypothetical protein P1V51_23550 [Deltaproteobacteria bacterium]|nr:hypothetical protein [Deltaproteobacteria bacterium]
MRFPAPVTRAQVCGLFLISPPLFALLGGAGSLLFHHATLRSETLEKLGDDLHELALWIAAVSAVAGLLFAWVQWLRFKAAGVEAPDEGERLRAFVEAAEKRAAVSSDPAEAGGEDQV